MRNLAADKVTGATPRIWAASPGPKVAMIAQCLCLNLVMNRGDLMRPQQIAPPSIGRKRGIPLNVDAPLADCDQDCATSYHLGWSDRPWEPVVGTTLAAAFAHSTQRTRQYVEGLFQRGTTKFSVEAQTRLETFGRQSSFERSCPKAHRSTQLEVQA